MAARNDAAPARAISISARTDDGALGFPTDGKTESAFASGSMASPRPMFRINGRPRRPRTRRRANDGDRPTVARHLTDWLASIKSSVRTRTFEKYEDTVNKHLVPRRLGRIGLEKNWRRDVQALLDEKLNNFSIRAPSRGFDRSRAMRAQPGNRGGNGSRATSPRTGALPEHLSHDIRRSGPKNRRGPSSTAQPRASRCLARACALLPYACAASSPACVGQTSTSTPASSPCGARLQSGLGLDGQSAVFEEP